MRFACGTGGLVCVAALLCAGIAAADPPAPRPGEKDTRARQAMALHDEASALYEQGRYRAAIERLEAALRIDPSGAELVYNLALIHEKLAEVDVAERYYRRYLEMETDPKARARIQGILRRLAGARKELPPAPHAAGPRADAPALPSPVPEPARHRPLGTAVLATGGVAATALVVGTVFALVAVTKNPGSGARTGDGVGIRDLQNDARTAHTDAIIADVTLLIGLLTGGTAVTLHLLTDPVPVARTEARPRPPSGLFLVRF